MQHHAHHTKTAKKGYRKQGSSKEFKINRFEKLCVGVCGNTLEQDHQEMSSILADQ